MGFLNLLFGKKDEISENPLEKERQAILQKTKDEIYQECYSKLTEAIPDRYKNNYNDCSVGISLTFTMNVNLDDDVVHKILTKAAYDAMKSVKLKCVENPSIKLQNFFHYRIVVKWK
ncbi:MAG: hypothetical protein AB7S75_01005 [Desulfococcaceae bacterium]